MGLEVGAVVEGGPADRAGLRGGDLLLTVGPIRVHDLAQLWTVLAVLPWDPEECSDGRAEGVGWRGR